MINTLKLWKMRNLSIIGKNLIIKSLGVSSLLYAASMLPVSEEFCKRVQTAIFDFIWDSKPPKVRNQTMITEIRDGGLKILDFQSQMKALKLTWVKRLYNNNSAKWKLLFQSYIPFINITDLFHTRCSNFPENLQIPTFYKEIISAWNEVRKLCLPNTTSDIQKESLWFNDFIKINQKSVFFSKWYRAGILFVRDIINPDGSILGIDQLNRTFNLQVDIMQYNGIISAIPRQWKRTLKSELVHALNIKSPVLNLQGKLCPIVKAYCKDFYWSLISLIRKLPEKNIEKWNREFDINVPDWELIFTLSFKTTYEIKMQAFQFKILHRYIVHNVLLFRMGINDSPGCLNCNLEESIKHKFFECVYIQLFWKAFIEWWNVLDIQRIDLEYKDVILGLYEIDLYSVNNCILTAKYYIHYCWCKKIKPIFNRFLIYLKYKIELEKIILYRNNQGNTFVNRWQSIYDRL